LRLRYYREFEEAKNHQILTRKHHAPPTEKKPTEKYEEELRHEFNHFGTYFTFLKV
jgi:hypothetical protein